MSRAAPQPANARNARSTVRVLYKSGMVIALHLYCGGYGSARAHAQATTASGLQTANLFGCPMFPANNIWNARVDHLPVESHSSAWVSSVGVATGLHMDFGSGTWDGGPIGIPYNPADSNTATYAVDFYYGAESDAGPYPIPDSPLIEYGSDHHLLVVDDADCTLYEIYDASQNTGGSWSGGSGAIWDLASNALRPAGWTSADAAGLPILPGLVRYDEVASGEITHAIRFTTHATNSYTWPARHLTSGSPGVLTSTPPMGARFRLKASFDISSYPTQMQVILRAMKQYGIILADNGSDWFITGAPDPRWDDDMLHTLDDVTGQNFEVVDESSLMVSPDSGRRRSGAAADFDGNYASDVVVYSGGAWQFYDFATGDYVPGSSVWAGNPGGCIPAPMDYDGDASKEFTQLCGNAWHFYNDDGGYNKGIWIGLPGAVPVPGDYDGDGMEDVVAFDGGAWQHYDFASGTYDAGGSVWTGLPGGAGTPAAMDYDGNGTADPTILDSTGAWHFYNDNGSYDKGIWIGIGGAVPAPGDYSGDGTDQPVVFDGGAWQFFDFGTGLYDAGSSKWTGAPAAVGNGVAGPAPLDYDGDGHLDFTYYAGGAWHFYNADGSYNKGIWTGGTAGDEAISRRQLP